MLLKERDATIELAKEKSMKVFNGHMFETRNEGPLSGDFCTGEASKGTPCMHWHGEWFPPELLEQSKAILAFAAPNEAVIQLFYHNEGIEGRHWAIFVPPQSGTSSSVKELPRTDPRWKPYFTLLEQNWYPWGSFHSHPGFGAFQSGIDKHDEVIREGFHCTFGKLSSPVWELDSRLIVNNFMYKPFLHEWFYVPRAEQLVTFPEDVLESWFKHCLPDLLKRTPGDDHGYKDMFDNSAYSMPVTGEEFLPLGHFYDPGESPLTSPSESCSLLEEYAKELRGYQSEYQKQEKKKSRKASHRLQNEIPGFVGNPKN